VVRAFCTLNVLNDFFRAWRTIGKKSRAVPQSRRCPSFTAYTSAKISATVFNLRRDPLPNLFRNYGL